MDSARMVDILSAAQHLTRSRVRQRAGGHPEGRKPGAYAPGSISDAGAWGKKR